MRRRSFADALLISCILACAGLHAETPLIQRPAVNQPAAAERLKDRGLVPNLPAGPAVPSSLTVSPDKLVIGSAPTFTVTMAGVQTTATQFKLLSDMVNGWTMSIPAGRIAGTTSPLMTDPAQWRYYNFCVTPDMNEKTYPCINKDSKKVTLAPFDAGSVQISSFKLNGDATSPSVVVPRNKPILLEIRLNAIPPAANILMSSTDLDYNRVIYAVGNVAADAIPVPMQLSMGGKTGSGVIKANYNGKNLSRNIQILPLQQVDKTCFFDIRPTAGSWSATVDYCGWEINPGKVTGGETANGFIRRGFASPEWVYLELSSSDPSVATVSPASAGIPNQQRGLTFAVKTMPTGGAPKTVTIKVVEGGSFVYTIPLTVN
jgi:hypothetical protein